MNVYVIYDKLAKTCAGPLMCIENDVLAKRTVSSAKLNDIIDLHTEDFDLMQVGTIDPTVPEIVGLANPVLVCHLEELRTNGCK